MRLRHEAIEPSDERTIRTRDSTIGELMDHLGAKKAGGHHLRAALRTSRRCCQETSHDVPVAL